MSDATTLSQAPEMAVLGAGAWGTALAMVMAGKGCPVTLWMRHEARAADIRAAGENRRYLPGNPLPALVAPTAATAALGKADIVIVAVPAQHMGEVLGEVGGHLGAGVPLVITAKGIEASTGRFMTEVVADACPNHPLAVLSGPTFADEVARGLPTAATLATTEDALGPMLLERLATRTFRLYLSDDVVGVQLGGAIKNVIAIASGIVEGRGLGANARAALVTRALAEMSALGRAFGAREGTLSGLAGLGDLILTTTSRQSRNTSLGVRLGEEESLDAILASRHSVAEGVHTAAAIVAAGQRYGVELPISEAVCDIVERRITIDAAIDRLLSRPLKAEPSGAPSPPRGDRS